jgi:hypothetical protein
MYWIETRGTAIAMKGGRTHRSTHVPAFYVDPRPLFFIRALRVLGGDRRIRPYLVMMAGSSGKIPTAP